MKQEVPRKPDYARVFNRLSHMIALSDEGKLQSTVDDSILSSLAIDCGQTRVAGVADVIALVRAYYGISLGEHLVQPSMDRLVAKGKLLRDRISRALLVSPDVTASIRKRIDEARDLESQVRNQWLESLDCSETLAEADELWHCLQAYMAKAFERHGVETITLLVPDLLTSRRDNRHLSAYLEESIEAECHVVPHDKAFDAVQRFFRESTTDRTRYVAQLLDATFAYFALSADRATSAYLQGRISPLTLLLDTNFIFGVLNLHSHHLNAVSRELVDLVQNHKLPFRLCYHEVTLRETERTIDFIGDRLRGRRWTQATSRAAVRSGLLSGVETRYHEMNAERGPIAPEDFLMRYAHLEAELQSYGFTAFTRGASSKELDDERHQLVAEYDAYIKDHRPRGPKRYEALNHDMTVWQAVRRLRTNGHSALDVGAFLLTTDYYLFCFDWYTQRRPDTLGLVVMPNQFLQVLRPFVTPDNDADRSLAETFAIPALRAATTDYSATVSRVLSVLNSFAGMNEDTALSILADQVLIRQLSEIDPASEEFAESIENEVVRQNEYLQDRQRHLESAAQESRRLAAESQALLARQQEDTEIERQKRLRVEAEAERIRQDAEAARLRAESSEATSKQVTDEYSEKLRQLEDAHKHDARRLVRIVCFLSVVLEISLTLLIARVMFWDWAVQHLGMLFGAILLLVGVTAWVAVERGVDWPWLANHEHKAGLRLAALFLVVGLAAMVACPDAIGIWAASLVISVLSSLVQIVKR